MLVNEAIIAIKLVFRGNCPNVFKEKPNFFPGSNIFHLYDCTHMPFPWGFSFAFYVCIRCYLVGSESKDNIYFVLCVLKKYTVCCFRKVMVLTENQDVIHFVLRINEF